MSTTTPRRGFLAAVSVAAMLTIAGAAAGASSLRITITPIEAPAAEAVPGNIGSTYAPRFESAEHCTSSGHVVGQMRSNKEFLYIASPASGGSPMKTLAIAPAPVPTGTTPSTVNIAILKPLTVANNGHMLIEGCTPPASGNGVCPWWMARYSLDAGFVPLDVAASGATTAANDPIIMNAAGDIGIVTYGISGSGATATSSSSLIIQSPTGAWTRVNVAIPPAASPYYAPELRAFNGARQMIVSGGYGQPLYRVNVGPSEGGVANGWIDLTLPSTFTVKSMNERGDLCGSASGAAFMFAADCGLQPLDASNAFPSDHARKITTPIAGAIPGDIGYSPIVVGIWQDGYFTWTAERGMKNAGAPAFAATTASGQAMQHSIGEITSVNSMGDFTAMAMENYAPVPVIKIGELGAQRVQDIVDPAKTKILVSAVSGINDEGEAAVFGNVPSGWNGQQPGAPLVLKVKFALAASDYDRSGATTIDDVFIYLNAWFAGSKRADTDRGGTTTVDDVFVYLNTWFAGT